MLLFHRGVRVLDCNIPPEQSLLHKYYYKFAAKTQTRLRHSLKRYNNKPVIVGHTTLETGSSSSDDNPVR